MPGPLNALHDTVPVTASSIGTASAATPTGEQAGEFGASLSRALADTPAGDHAATAPGSRRGATGAAVLAPTIMGGGAPVPSASRVSSPAMGPVAKDPCSDATPAARGAVSISAWPGPPGLTAAGSVGADTAAARVPGENATPSDAAAVTSAAVPPRGVAASVSPALSPETAAPANTGIDAPVAALAVVPGPATGTPAMHGPAPRATDAGASPTVGSVSTADAPAGSPTPTAPVGTRTVGALTDRPDTPTPATGTPSVRGPATCMTSAEASPAQEPTAAVTPTTPATAGTVADTPRATGAHPHAPLARRDTVDAQTQTTTPQRPDPSAPPTAPQGTADVSAVPVGVPPPAPKGGDPPAAMPAQPAPTATDPPEHRQAGGHDAVPDVPARAPDSATHAARMPDDLGGPPTPAVSDQGSIAQTSVPMVHDLAHASAPASTARAADAAGAMGAVTRQQALSTAQAADGVSTHDLQGQSQREGTAVAPQASPPAIGPHALSATDTAGLPAALPDAGMPGPPTQPAQSPTPETALASAGESPSVAAPSPVASAAWSATVGAGPVSTTHASPGQQVAPVLLALATAPTGSQRMTLRLQPAELGTVQVRIDRPVAAPIRIEISVSRPETLTLMLRDQTQLQRALDQAGLPSDRCNVNLQLAGQDAGSSSRQSQGFDRPDTGTSTLSDQADDPSDADIPTTFMPAARPGWHRLGLDITA